MLSTVKTLLSPAEISSLPALRLPLASRITKSCAREPPLTRKNTTLPCGWLMVDGSKLYSVIVTLNEPEGCDGPPPPQAATRANVTSATASVFLTGTAELRDRESRKRRSTPHRRSAR